MPHYFLDFSCILVFLRCFWVDVDVGIFHAWMAWDARKRPPESPQSRPWWTSLRMVRSPRRRDANRGPLRPCLAASVD